MTDVVYGAILGTKSDPLTTGNLNFWETFFGIAMGYRGPTLIAPIAQFMELWEYGVDP
jgi:hypothetical protein